MKKMNLDCHGNRADLAIERDAGNLIYILMGKPSYALPAWKRLRRLCKQAIDYLETQKD